MGYADLDYESQISREILKVQVIKYYLDIETYDLDNVIDNFKRVIEVFPEEKKDSFFKAHHFKRIDQMESYDSFLRHLTKLCLQENVCIRFELDLEAELKELGEDFYGSVITVINNIGQMVKEDFVNEFGLVDHGGVNYWSCERNQDGFYLIWQNVDNAYFASPPEIHDDSEDDDFSEDDDDSEDDEDLEDDEEQLYSDYFNEIDQQIK